MATGLQLACGGLASLCGEPVVGAAPAWAFSGRGAGQPLVLVFGSAGEPAAVLEFLQQRVESSLIDAGRLMDFEPVELAVRGCEQVGGAGRGFSKICRKRHGDDTLVRNRHG